MKKLKLFSLALMALFTTSVWAVDVTWDFSDRSAQSFTANRSSSFMATDGETEMRYSAGSSDEIVAKDGTTSGYLKENGKTGSGTVYDIDGKTNIGKTRLIRLYVSGNGTLTINCNTTNKGVYKVRNGSSSGTVLVNSLGADTASAAINVTTSPIWIETSTKGYITSIVWSPIKPISSQTLAGVKVGGTALTQDAATSGYSISSTTITLSNDILYIATPSNITLTNHIVYTDESSEDKNVTVTFDGTITAGYYIGTASIGETSYTVKAKQNVSPAIELSATSGSIAIANSYTVVDSITVTLTGANLTNGTYDVTASVAGTTISPTSFTVSDGVVSQEFKMISSASSAASTVFTFGTSAMGIAAPTYTLSYSRVAQRDLSQTDVTASTTWDWTNAGSSEVLLTEKGKDKATADTDPKRGTDFLLAKLPEIDNDGDFNSQALLVNCQYPNRGGYFQGSKVVFTTTVPGKVKVIYSNTGSKNGTRYVIVNETVDTSGSSSSKSGNDRTSDEIAVSAGTVTITAKQIKDGEETANAMLQISKIIFTAKYAVTFDAPANGTLVVKNGEDVISSGDLFVAGTVLDVVATPASNEYALTALTAGEENILASKQFTVGTSNVAVSATFAEKPAAPISWASATASIALNGDAATLQTLTNESSLTVAYSSDNTDVASINDETGAITLKAVGTANITATYTSTAEGAYKTTEVSYELTVTAATYAVTFAAPENGTLVVKKGDDAITSGDKFIAGTALTVVATPDEDFVLKTLTANGSDIKEALSFTVGTAAVEVVAVFEEKGSGTALDNTSDEIKAVKFLENGQLFIRRGEKVYTITGELVK